MASGDGMIATQQHDDSTKDTEIDDSVTTPLSVDVASRPASNCSTTVIETPNISPAASESADSYSNATKTDVCVPKLRLNVTLASDPALQPEARDIKCRVKAAECLDDRVVDSDDDLQEIRTENDQPIRVMSDTEDERPPPEKIRRRDDHLSVLVSKNVPTPNPMAAVIPDLATRHPAFVCIPCGIKFSSMSTLEAHQTYYCSHKYVFCAFFYLFLHFNH